MELRPVCDALQEQIDGLLAQALLVLLHVGEFIPLCKARRHVEADDGQVLGHAQTHGLRSAPDEPGNVILRGKNGRDLRMGAQVLREVLQILAEDFLPVLAGQVARTLVKK